MPIPQRGSSSRKSRGFWSAIMLIGAAALGAAPLAGCQLATPFRGPGYAKGRGVTLDNTPGTVWVGVTNAQVDGSTRAVFDDYTQRVLASLPGQEGFIGSSVRSRVFGNEVWTMTVWRDERSLDAFVSSPTHRAAMREGLGPVIRAKFLRFEIATSAVPPSWADVLKRLESVEFKDYGRPGAGSSGR